MPIIKHQTPLLVGSLNPAKIHAAQAAVQRCFPHQKITAAGVNVPSGVRDQPFGDEDTLLGATNRVQALAAAWQEQRSKPRRQQRQQQQYAGQQQQLMQQQQQQQQQMYAGQQSQQLQPSPASSQALLHCAPQSLLIAIEGGVLQRCCGGLYCFAWAAVQLAGGGKVSTARSAEFLLPRQLSDLVLGGMELGAADDAVFGRTKSGQGNGTVGKLTADVVTGAAYYEHAMMMALIPFMNPDLYPKYGLMSHHPSHDA